MWELSCVDRAGAVSGRLVPGPHKRRAVSAAGGDGGHVVLGASVDGAEGGRLNVVGYKRLGSLRRITVGKVRLYWNPRKYVGVSFPTGRDLRDRHLVTWWFIGGPQAMFKHARWRDYCPCCGEEECRRKEASWGA